ncbi:MAG: 23S rRNA (adenine(2503)-C(2))-methyltransferase RlmN, partial [Rhodospirillales bacterium]
MAHQRTNLIGLSREELAAALAGAGATPLRAKQLWHWMYYRGVTDFAA